MTRCEIQRKTIRRQVLLGLACVAALAASSRWTRTLTATSADGAPSAVTIDNFNFGPRSVAVPAGTTITWTNHDDVPHNVIGTDKSFASPVIDTDQQFSHTFETAGTFKYYCSIHPKMTGEVVVRDPE